MAHDVARAGHAASDPLTASFSPDWFRRFILRSVTPLVVSKLLKPGMVMRADQLAQFPAPDGQVVMLGDSITEQGLWQEWFTGTPVLNRGVGSQTSADLLERLDGAIGRPAAIFVLIGTNDISFGVPLSDVVGNVLTLLGEVQRRAPGTPVVVQSVMPRTARFADDVRLLNRAYRAVAAHAGDTVEYLDLWPALVDDRGTLRKQFTEDGLHLNGHGYAAWVEVLRPHVERIHTRGHRQEP